MMRSSSPSRRSGRMSTRSPIKLKGPFGNHKPETPPVIEHPRESSGARPVHGSATGRVAYGRSKPSFAPHTGSRKAAGACLPRNSAQALAVDNYPGPRAGVSAATEKPAPSRHWNGNIPWGSCETGPAQRNPPRSPRPYRLACSCGPIGYPASEKRGSGDNKPGSNNWVSAKEGETG
jgi:hypothetical protein